MENFDADKVKVFVWSGEVILKNLKLKRDALYHLLDKTGTRERSKTCKKQRSD